MICFFFFGLKGKSVLIYIEVDQTKEVKQAESQYNPNICRMQKCTKMIRYFFCKCLELLSMTIHIKLIKWPYLSLLLNLSLRCTVVSSS